MTAVSERERHVRESFAAVGEQDFTRLLANYHEDCVWDWSRSLGPFAGVYEGHEAIVELIQGVTAVAGRLHFEVERLDLVGDHAVADMKVVIVGRDSGLEASARGTHVITFDGDRIRSHTLFQERAEALEAAG